MTVFRQIVPNSSVNTYNESYEYLLLWLSPQGGVRQYLFSHTEGEKEIDHQLFVIEQQDNIRSIPEEVREEVEVNTLDLDSDEYEYVKSILASNRVWIIDKQGNQTPIAIQSAKTVRSNKNKSFEISLTFIFVEENILNV